MTDEQQKRLFIQILSGHDVYWEKKDYYILLMQIEPDRFAENALENELRTLHKNASVSPNPDEFLLKSAFYHIDIRVSSIDGHCIAERPLSFGVAPKNGNFYNFNILALFTQHVSSSFSKRDPTVFRANVEAIKNYASRMISSEMINQNVLEFQLDFKVFDSSDCITNNERQHFYNLLIQIEWGDGIYVLISEWLDKLDAKRASLESPSFIDDL